MAKKGKTSGEVIAKECTKQPLAHLHNQVEEFLKNGPTKGKITCQAPKSAKHYMVQVKIIKITAHDCRNLVGTMTGHSLLRGLTIKIGLSTSYSIIKLCPGYTILYIGSMTIFYF